jgi:ankyrin repeat protein
LLVDLCSQDGMTALHYAADYDFPAVVTALLGLGADASIVDKAGRTPLRAAEQYAAEWGNAGCVAALSAAAQH